MIRKKEESKINIFLNRYCLQSNMLLISILINILRSKCFDLSPLPFLKQVLWGRNFSNSYNETFPPESKFAQSLSSRKDWFGYFVITRREQIFPFPPPKPFQGNRIKNPNDLISPNSERPCVSRL